MDFKKTYEVLTGASFVQETDKAWDKREEEKDQEIREAINKAEQNMLAKYSSDRKKSINKNLKRFAVAASFLAVGGVADVMTNDTDLSLSTDHSNPKVVAEYESRISLLEQKAATIEKGAANTSVDAGELNDEVRKEGRRLLSNAVADRGLSEENVHSLSQRFAQNIMPVDNIGSFELSHLEYLDECKADNPDQIYIGDLDNCTIEKYEDAESDGPWMGIIIAALAHDLLFPKVVRAMGMRRKENDDAGIIEKAALKLSGKRLPTNW